MFITVTMEIEGSRFDVRLDGEQTPEQALRALIGAGKCADKTVDFYRSLCGNRIISAYRTLEEQQIYNGDLLRALTERDKIR